jgi:hypothetical protein
LVSFDIRASRFHNRQRLGGSCGLCRARRTLLRQWVDTVGELLANLPVTLSRLGQ